MSWFQANPAEQAEALKWSLERMERFKVLLRDSEIYFPTDTLDEAIDCVTSVSEYLLRHWHDEPASDGVINSLIRGDWK